MSSSKNFRERREAIRAKRILNIQYRLAKSRYKSGDRRWHLSTTHDMSAKGLAFLSDVPYHIGDILELHTVMSGVIDVIKGFGKVIRIEQKRRSAAYLLAVQFVDSKIARTRPAISKKVSF